MSNYIPAPQNAQPSQGQNWEPIETGCTYETYRSYVTPTGHNVCVTIVNHETCSHVHIVVSDETGFYNASNAHFDGYDHDEVSLEFADNYLYSYELQSICANFDNLCLEFGNMPAA
jgi:hypothetical protein